MTELNIRQKREKREYALLNAWLWDLHANHLQWRRVRLGPLPTKELARMYSVLQRWADAILIVDDIVWIVEAKVRPNFGAIGQLEGYAGLFPRTPEFTAYKDWPVQLVLLTMLTDMTIVDMCNKKGIRYEVYPIEKINLMRRSQGLPEMPMPQ